MAELESFLKVDKHVYLKNIVSRFNVLSETSKLLASTNGKVKDVSLQDCPTTAG